MTIDDDAVAHVARLARIRLSDEERTQLRADLGQMLTHFEDLEAIDTTDVEPTFHTVTRSPLRPDEPRREVEPKALQEAAPKWIDSGFAVPKVLE